MIVAVMMASAACSPPWAEVGGTKTIAAENTSPSPVVVRVWGSDGAASFDIPARSTVGIDVPARIGVVTSAEIFDQSCRLISAGFGGIGTLLVGERTGGLKTVVPFTQRAS